MDQRPNTLNQRKRTYHLVGQDAVDAGLVEANEPVEAVELVVAQLTALQNGGLPIESCQCKLGVIVVSGPVLAVVQVGARPASSLVGAQDAVA